MTTHRVLGICASLRRESANRTLLECAIELAPGSIKVETFERLGEIPPYNEDVKERGFPDPVAELRRRIGEADGVLIASPEYNYTIPGVLKNAIDWVSRPPEQPFAGKPIALMGATPGVMGTARGQRSIRDAFLFLDGRIMNTNEVMVPGVYDKIEDSRLTDEQTRKFVGDMMKAFADWIALHGK